MGCAGSKPPPAAAGKKKQTATAQQQKLPQSKPPLAGGAQPPSTGGNNAAKPASAAAGGGSGRVAAKRPTPTTLKKNDSANKLKHPPLASAKSPAPAAAAAAAAAQQQQQQQPSLTPARRTPLPAVLASPNPTTTPAQPTPSPKSAKPGSATPAAESERATPNLRFGVYTPPKLQSGSAGDGGGGTSDAGTDTSTESLGIRVSTDIRYSPNGSSPGQLSAPSLPNLGGFGASTSGVMASSVYLDTPTEKASPALMQAIDDANEVGVYTLLHDKKASANGIDPYGYTPLHKAALRNEQASLNILKSLIKYGAEVNALDGWQLRPLHAAVRQKNKAAVAELLTCHPMADPLGGGKPDQLFTPIHEAAEKGHWEILEKLLAACGGRDTTPYTAATQEGETALHVAAKKGRVRCVSLLALKMKKLAMSLDARDGGPHGHTPLILAAIGGHRDVMNKLQELGARMDGENLHGHTVISVLAMRAGDGFNTPNGTSYDPYSSPPTSPKGGVGSRKKGKPADVPPIPPASTPNNKTTSPGPLTPVPATPPVAHPAPSRKPPGGNADGFDRSSSRVMGSTPPRQLALSDTDLMRWQKGRVLGKGAFGMVYEGLLRDGTLLAVKIIDFNMDDKSETEAVKQEFDIIKNLRHKNILQYYGLHMQDGKMEIFMEMAAKGSIASLVKRINDALAIPYIRNVARQVLEGLEYLHAHGVIHRDIKGDNLLVGDKNEIKLCDFGSCRQFNGLMTADRCNTLIGTPLWMAPEVINLDGQSGYNTKADIWSFGITLIEMLNCSPWKDATTETPWAMMFHIASSDKPPDGIPETCNPMLRSCMLRCFERSPDKRPSATELLKHPFLNCEEDELERCV